MNKDGHIKARRKLIEDGTSNNRINSSEGVLYAEIAALALGSNNRYISLSDGTSNNRIIGLGFFKKDGTFRTGAFRRGVVKGITGEGLKFNPKDYNLITLYDMNAKGYRNVPIDRLKYIKALGQTIDCDVFKTLDKVEA